MQVQVATVNEDGSTTTEVVELEGEWTPPDVPDDFWCTCGNPSGMPVYRCDPETGSHWWDCADCGGCLQVG